MDAKDLYYWEHETQGFRLPRVFSDEQAINLARRDNAKIWSNEDLGAWVILDQHRAPALYLAHYQSEASAAHAYCDYYRFTSEY